MISISRLEEGIAYIFGGIIGLYIGFSALRDPLQLGVLTLFCIALILMGIVRIFGRGR